MSQHIDRLRAFQHWYINAPDKSHAEPELLDALALLADYDALRKWADAARQWIAESPHRERYGPASWGDNSCPARDEDARCTCGRDGLLSSYTGGERDE